MAAKVRPSRAKLTLVSMAGPRQRVAGGAERLTLPSISSPSWCAVNTMSPPARQDSQLAEARRSPVRLRAAPPAAGTSMMSPPLEPSSLISPWMTAMDAPSGDHRGYAIWKGGFQRDRVSPLAASTT